MTFQFMFSVNTWLLLNFVSFFNALIFPKFGYVNVNHGFCPYILKANQLFLLFLFVQKVNCILATLKDTIDDDEMMK